jgi:uncharacterized protein (DUF1015 family)
MTDVGGTIFSPFRAIRYNTAKWKDLSPLIAPPYDIISEQRQEALYARDERNFVRIELNRSGPETRYAEAAATLARWLSEDVLMREQAPALYLLEQEFTLAGRTWRRRGLFGLVRLPEKGRNYVLSHEGTLAEPKADRLMLMRACRAMTSPVMLMSEDPDGALMQLMQHVHLRPEATAEDGNGALNRLWVLREPSSIERFRATIGGGPLYIADGHHRFETALVYRDEMRRLHPGAPASAGFNHALALVNSAQDEGLRIFPTHRLISGLNGNAKAALWNCVERYFEVESRPSADLNDIGGVAWLEASGPGRPVFAAYSGDGRLHLLVGKQEALPASVGSVVERLDVSVLHNRVIDPTLAGTGCALGAGGQISHDSHVSGPTGRGLRLTYTTDARQAMAAVDRGDYDIAFLLRPTRVAEVMAAARAGERMPGKSTYFYPKIPAGLVVSDASEEPV